MLDTGISKMKKKIEDPDNNTSENNSNVGLTMHLDDKKPVPWWLKQSMTRTKVINNNKQISKDKYL